ncbi:MAG TPA: M48 family metallopeptidase [Acidimicrobiales bacterium]|nr:M48 family metallopeptidase [Acidimicrobiales bacterium]
MGTQESQASARRDGPHPSVTKRTPSRNDDFFHEDELRTLREYIRPLRRNKRIRVAMSTALELWLIFGLDLGPRAAAWIAGQGWALRLLVVVALFDIVGQAIRVPFAAWANLVYEKRAGHSTMTVGTFVKDQLLEFALGIVINMAMLVPVYAAIHAFGSAWWMVGAGFIFALIVALNFVAPIWIMPRFNKFTPLPEGPIRSRIEELATLQGVEIEGVYLMDASRRTNRANAGVTGFGKTKRVIVNDTICDFPIEELSQVIAHELGHYRLNHVVKGILLQAVQFPFALLFIHLVASNDEVLRWAGLRDLGDPASYPLFGVLFGLAMSVFSLASMFQSRTYEREADLESLELLGDPTSFVAVWPRMVLNDKARMEPTPWEKLTSTHPEIAERMQFGLDWAGMNDVAVTKPAPRSVPEPEKPAPVAP